MIVVKHLCILINNLKTNDPASFLPQLREKDVIFLIVILFNNGLYINLVASYLISFPLMMGEGKDGGERPGPPPHLNPPPP